MNSCNSERYRKTQQLPSENPEANGVWGRGKEIWNERRGVRRMRIRMNS